MKLSISMTPRERWLGIGYLLISIFVLPFVFDFLNTLLPRPLTATELNILFFALNFVCVCLIFRNFLQKSIKAAIRKPLRCLFWGIVGLVMYYAITILWAVGIQYITPNFSNVNDDSIIQMTQTYTWLMVFSTGVLVPVYEEVLYRGVVFRGLHKKSRVLAYSVSMIVFSAIHVMGYIGFVDKLTLFLCFTQYLPAGLALAFAYERTDTIVTPILMHIVINQISLMAMR